MEVVIGLGILIGIIVILIVYANKADKRERERLCKKEERLRKEAEEKEELRQRRLAYSLSLIYVFSNRDLSASFNEDDFDYYAETSFRHFSFASISELQNEGFIKAVTSAYRNYDNNGIYKYTTPAQYKITETGIAFLKNHYRGSHFEYKLNKQQAPWQMSVEELQIEAAKKDAIEKQEMQKRIKQLEAKIEGTEQEQQALQNHQNMLTLWAINNHYNHHK